MKLKHAAIGLALIGASATADAYQCKSKTMNRGGITAEFKLEMEKPKKGNEKKIKEGVLYLQTGKKLLLVSLPGPLVEDVLKKEGNLAGVVFANAKEAIKRYNKKKNIAQQWKCAEKPEELPAVEEETPAPKPSKADDLIIPPDKPGPQPGTITPKDVRIANDLKARIQKLRKNKEAMRISQVSSKLDEADEILKNPLLHRSASLKMDDAESYFQRSQTVKKSVEFKQFDYSKPILPVDQKGRVSNDDGFKFDEVGSKAAIKRIMPDLQAVYNGYTRSSHGGSAGGELKASVTVNKSGKVVLVKFTEGPGVLMNNKDALGQIAGHIGRVKFDTKSDDPTKKPDYGTIILLFTFQGR